MPDLSLANAQVIAAQVLDNLVGQTFNCSNVATPIAVYPQANSGLAAEGATPGEGRRASSVYVRPGGDVYLGVDIPAVAGNPSALLFTGAQYNFNLHPAVNTLYFICPTGTSVQLNWLIR